MRSDSYETDLKVKESIRMGIKSRNKLRVDCCERQKNREEDAKLTKCTPVRYN